MVHWGIGRDISCLLSDEGIDSKKHVLLQCHYSCCVREGFRRKFRAMPNWEEEMTAISRRFLSDSSFDRVGRVTWRAIIE
ncbi:hypothetical protein LINPERPRIM_LOCUS37145 [Linum perenne]